MQGQEAARLWGPLRRRAIKAACRGVQVMIVALLLNPVFGPSAWSQDRGIEDVFCDGDLAPFCTRQGMRFFDRFTSERTDMARRTAYLERATFFFASACNAGDMRGCVYYGDYFKNYDSESTERRRHRRAAELYQTACAGGDMMGCIRLGDEYYSGTGVPQDEAKATASYRKACDGGHDKGCYLVGISYSKGQGVEQRAAGAAEFFNRACDLGHAMGCLRAGTYFAHGLGVDANLDMARDRYRRACDGGHEQACTDLGMLYAQPGGIDQDRRLARMFFERGCSIAVDAQVADNSRACLRHRLFGGEEIAP